jgi:hypothetical protein
MVDMPLDVGRQRNALLSVLIRAIRGYTIDHGLHGCARITQQFSWRGARIPWRLTRFTYLMHPRG